MKTACVITSISDPYKVIDALSNRCHVIIIGDEKSPKKFKHVAADFYGLDQQKSLKLSLIEHLPVNHYSRKNIGYLIAIAENYECIYDTDDDNFPNLNWKIRQQKCPACFNLKTGWCNAYKAFTDTHAWPRGFALEHIQATPNFSKRTTEIHSPIQQGLSDINPDVDAIWRMAHPESFYFEKSLSIALKQNSWCPFNSQSTWWWPEAYPLMYLPVTASFRMTDIWRSFVAQRCLWEMGFNVVFHSPSEVTQWRNKHDLFKDFKDELSGYLNNSKIVKILEKLPLKKGTKNVTENLMSCYQALVSNGTISSAELPTLAAWITDIKTITS